MTFQNPSDLALAGMTGCATGCCLLLQAGQMNKGFPTALPHIQPLMSLLIHAPMCFG